MSDTPLRVFLVEDHELTRRGLMEILAEGGFRVAGEAASVAVARSLASRTKYDIALLDVYLKDGDGVDLAIELVISVETVRSHVKSILRKLEVHTRAAAVAYLEEMRDSMELIAV